MTLYLRRIVGGSMMPTYHKGDVIIALRSKKIAIGMVVLATYQNRDVIKRIKHIEGDNIYLIGDNADASTDSRHYGPIHVMAIQGRVVKHFCLHYQSR